MKNYKIYKLIDPFTSEIRYVGVTTSRLSQRLSQHCYESKREIGSYKKHWIRKLLIQGQRPLIELIENCTAENWQRKEQYWISFYDNLTNTRNGGSGIVFKSDNSMRNCILAHQKIILQLDINLKVLSRYSSIKEAGEDLNILRTNIGNVLKGRALTAGGFHFVYEENYSENYFIELKSSNGVKLKRPLQITFSNGSSKEYNTHGEAAKDLDVNQSYIQMLLSGSRSIGKSKKLSNIKSIQYIKI